MSNDAARPIEIGNIMSARGVQLLRSVRLTFELIAEHGKKHPAEKSTINAAIASHLRSSDPLAAQQVPSVEMPTITSPAVPLFIEPATKLEVKLDGDRAGYTFLVDGDLVAVRLHDVSGDDVLVYMTPEQFGEYVANGKRVLAAVKP